MELASKYNPADVEGKWYQYWLDNKLFSSKQTMRREKNNSGSKQKLHQLTEQEKLYGVLKWGMTTSEKTFTGEGKVGDYTLSQDFIDAIRTNSTWAQYDENELNTAGYAHTQD